MVLLSRRTNHFITRNLNLKMGFFRRKIAVIGQPFGIIQPKISRIMCLLEVYHVVFLDFYWNFFSDFLRKVNLQGVDMVQLRRL
jgi:hypothetical protein